MITYLVGTLEHIGENTLVIEVYGVGYEVFCSSRTLSELNGTREKVKIYIHEHIKEDGHDLYGFYHMEDRELFRKLISVSGIGPKGGMQVFNTYSSQEVIEIILNQDSKALSKVSGIGPKTAQRIILELKDSIGKLFVPDLSLLETGLKDESAKAEAIEALEALGYAAQEARKAVEAIYDYKANSEELIKKALSLLGM
ncbi:Holliday junction branch migration protein RuvA [Cellulosilyticum sp. ST5]|uniref:Holliday junction branch migration complex subunit RuvA n=1 Tax=Cellulosilyticum lentocellum (strain ATCC 49066 / DSM 5427 / NCIMB 11756 / RHM5) TaxID=642492 RepID=F2JSW7_CELLD|nr:Holliday junction branch migration protein RuvA [Cellulosilyticum lentocellum]ADZ84088.1 Holliday junction DNA helicase RuvA [Cellulosilyticum lentocellum DSM 5427]